MEALLLVVPLLVGLLVGRWWIAPVLAAVFIAAVAVAAVAENYVGACDRPDGCGAGPVAGAMLWALLGGAVIAAAAAVGVLIRRRATLRT